MPMGPGPLGFAYFVGVKLAGFGRGVSGLLGQYRAAYGFASFGVKAI